jgi:hypothetical protein
VVLDRIGFSIAGSATSAIYGFPVALGHGLHSR